MNLYRTSSFSFYLWCFFWPPEFGYRATRVFDSGWIQYFGGLIWVWNHVTLVVEPELRTSGDRVNRTMFGPERKDARRRQRSLQNVRGQFDK
jgi:hypothetical protein